MRYKLKEKEATRKLKVKVGCRHCWIIESADGPTSRGVCKLCGAEKEFLNSSPELTLGSRHTRVFDLPELPDIEPDRDRDDSELEESNAGLPV